MQFGKVKDYLSQEHIKELKAGLASIPGTVDPLDMPLEEYVTTYREKQRAFLMTSSVGRSSAEMNAHNWFGNPGRMLELPADETTLYRLPVAEDNWRSASLWDSLDASVATERQRCLDIMKAASLGLIQAKRSGALHRIRRECAEGVGE